jgi:hypothetical protein
MTPWQFLASNSGILHCKISYQHCMGNMSESILLKCSSQFKYIMYRLETGLKRLGMALEMYWKSYEQGLFMLI